MGAKKAAKRLKKAKKRDQAVEESAETMGSPGVRRLGTRRDARARLPHSPRASASLG